VLVGIGAGSALSLLGALQVAILPAMLALLVGMPLTQALLLYFTSDERPRDQDPHLPGLYSPQEELPGWIPTVIPRWIVGGRQRSPQAPKEPQEMDVPPTAVTPEKTP